MPSLCRGIGNRLLVMVKFARTSSLSFLLYRPVSLLLLPLKADTALEAGIAMEYRAFVRPQVFGDGVSNAVDATTKAVSICPPAALGVPVGAERWMLIVCRSRQKSS